MANFYGNVIQKWQAYCDWNAKDNGDSVTITATVYFHSLAWGFNMGYTDGTVSIGGNSKTEYNKNINIGTGQTTNIQLCSHSVTLAKGDAQRNVTVSVSVNNHSGYQSGFSKGQANYTIPAKPVTKYKVTFDANGGTGAPQPQYKDKGIALTLSRTKPTRTGYTFDGWSITRNGTVNYRPGSAYTTDKEATLYAVWSYDKSNAPIVTSSDVFRVASSDSTAPNPNGNYIYFNISWTSKVAVKAAELTYKVNSSSSKATVQGDTSGTEGRSYGWFQVSASKRCNVIFTLTNTNSQSTEANFTVSAFTGSLIEIKNQGQGMGVLSEAPNNGINIGSFDEGAGMSINPSASTIEFNGAGKFNGYVQVPAVMAMHPEELKCTAQSTSVKFVDVSNMNPNLFALKDGGIQVKKAGWYRISGALRVDSYTNPRGSLAVGYFVNGLEPEELTGLIHSANNNFGISSVQLPIQIMQLKANDVVTIMCRTTGGGGSVTAGYLTISL